MTLFKCQMYLARTALIGDTFQIELEFRDWQMSPAEIDEITTKTETKNNKDNTKCAAQGFERRMQ